MLPPHHYPESTFTQVTNDLHAIKFKEFFQSLSYVASQWYLTLLTASSLLRHFLPLASLFFSYLSENALFVSFGGSFFSNWLFNVGVPQICIIFSPYTLSLGNLVYDHVMYPIFISLLRWLKHNSSSIHPRPNLGSPPWDLVLYQCPLFCSEWNLQLLSYAIQKPRSYSQQSLSLISNPSLSSVLPLKSFLVHPHLSNDTASHHPCLLCCHLSFYLLQ